MSFENPSSPLNEDSLTDIVQQFQQNASISPLAKPQKVRIHTTHFELVGYIYLSDKSRKNRELKDTLEKPQHFIALTQVTLQDLRTPQAPARQVPFLEVQIKTIEILEPIE